MKQNRNEDWRPPPRWKGKAKIRSWPVLPWIMVTILAILSIVDARSPHPPPLRRIHHPSRSSISILPRTPRTPQSRPRSFPQTSPHPSTLRHSDSVLLSISLPSLFQSEATLLLKPTENLFHPDARVTYGQGLSEPLREEDWRLYTGDVIRPNWVERIKWEEMYELRDRQSDLRAVVGHARIIVHEPGDGDVEPVFEGHFTVEGVTYQILTRDHYQRIRKVDDAEVDMGIMGQMVVFRDIDMYHDKHLPIETPSCSHDNHPFNSNLSHPMWQNRFANMFTPFEQDILGKRDDIAGGSTGTSNYINSINSTAGCPNTQQVVYMGVALDCNYVQTYGSIDAARTQVLNDWNQISALYKSSFNISLGIIELVVQNITCPSTAVNGTEWNVGCEDNLTLDERLSRFSQWRGNKGDDGAGLWHLMSACPTDSEVGVAWLGTLCQTDSNQQSGSYVSGTGISTATKTEWSLISHEIGHGFGAIHDCSDSCSLTGNCCPYAQSSCDANGRFIMNPTTSSTETVFSGCTLGNICSNIGTRAITTSCIQQPGSRTIVSLQQCGNGIIEEGEDCDPGANASSNCCDSQTCKFLSGAVCDPANSACCTNQCKVASAGVICRPSKDQSCDYSETCTGTNSTCPDDKTVPDGDSCGSDGLACASGQCTSLDQQCKSATATGSEYNLTKACGQRDDRSCVVSCRDPSVVNQCVVLQTPLIDGSPCGYGGHCYNSTCASGSWQDTAAGWYTSNLNIAIPVTIAAGLIVLGILAAITRCIWRACTSSARRSGSKSKSARQQRQSQLPSPPPPAPPMSQVGTGREPLPPPPPNRHSHSLTSQDGMMGNQAQPARQSGYGEGNRDWNDQYPDAGGYGGYIGREGDGGQQVYAGQPGYGGGAQYRADGGPPGSGGQGYGGGQPAGGWVDERLFNGRHYGPRQAYGR